ncbi:substrate-binding domain-containing protein [Terasakiella sp.]|uniref:substrate-binding domain-containing protein n=1 Tax=Terasakiella sp. TaxID=2034861 RepID=UPI003AA7BE39
MMKKLSSFLVVLTLLLGLSHTAQAVEQRFITVASTTSTANSGLFAYLLPQFTKETGIEVRVIAVGTGQAIRIARKGDADVLFVHHRPSEDKFVADGYGTKRNEVMYNDFIIVGPDNDPAHIKNCTSPMQALLDIRQSKQVFVSRGDNSGTHKRELSIWKAAEITPEQLYGSWYRSTGSGMGAALNITAGMDGYTLSDRGTWLAFKNKRKLVILCEGANELLNPYGVIAVNKNRFPHVKAQDSQIFIDWLVSDKGQKLIGDFKINGERLFTPNAQK